MQCRRALWRSDDLEHLQVAVSPKAAGRRYRQSATCGHSCCRKIAAPMTGLKVHRPLANFTTMRVTARRLALAGSAVRSHHDATLSFNSCSAPTLKTAEPDGFWPPSLTRTRRCPDMVDRAGAAQGTESSRASRRPESSREPRVRVQAQRHALSPLAVVTQAPLVSAMRTTGHVISGEQVDMCSFPARSLRAVRTTVCRCSVPQ